MTDKMTIATALRYAKKLKGKVDEARARATSCVHHYTDQAPPFDFPEQFRKANAASEELAELQGRIATANATSTIEHGDRLVTLACAVRHLQELKGRIAYVRSLPAKAASEMVEPVQVHVAGQGYQTVGRGVKCFMTNAEQAAAVDELQERFDSLNAAVEAANHRTAI